MQTFRDRVKTLFFSFLCFWAAAGEADSTWRHLEQKVSGSCYSQNDRDSLRRIAGIPAGTVSQAQINHAEQSPYEKIVWKLRWGPVSVGYIIIENYADSGVLYNVGKAVTTGVVKTFVEVRDMAISRSQRDSFQPASFQECIYEDGFGGDLYTAGRLTFFDTQRDSIFKFSRRDSLIRDSLAQGAHNYLSLVHALRRSPMAVGDTIELPAWVHEKNHIIRTIIHGREEVRTVQGTFECFKTEPLLVGDGRGLNRKDSVFVWFTADSARIPVKASLGARLGKFRGELVHTMLEEK
ncbi:MAG: DUF3108 domain-containing protein [Fibrobacterota bacterium]